MTQPPTAATASGSARPLISMALIVRDAEATLERCLASLAGHVDEIVVVDTGSTDETRAIARRHTDRVFDFPWVDDFARARQAAFDHATGEWVGWQDADEVLVNGAALRPAVAALDARANRVLWRTFRGRDAHAQPLLTYWQERLVRHDGAHQWRGRVHEVLVAADPARPSEDRYFRDIRTLHEDDAGGAGTDRNLRILEAAIEGAEAAGTSPDSRTLYYLAREYSDHGRVAEALTSYRRYLTVATWDDERYLAEIEVGRLLAGQRDWDGAAAACARAMILKPRWPMAYLDLAALAYYREQWADVIHWSDAGRALPPPETRLFVSRRALTHDWLIHYTFALSRLDRVEEALWWTQWALGNDPDDRWHRSNLTVFRDHLPDALRPLSPPERRPEPR